MSYERHGFICTQTINEILIELSINTGHFLSKRYGIHHGGYDKNIVQEIIDTVIGIVNKIEELIDFVKSLDFKENIERIEEILGADPSNPDPSMYTFGLPYDFFIDYIVQQVGEFLESLDIFSEPLLIIRMMGRDNIKPLLKDTYVILRDSGILYVTGTIQDRFETYLAPFAEAIKMLPGMDLQLPICDPSPDPINDPLNCDTFHLRTLEQLIDDASYDLPLRFLMRYHLHDMNPFRDDNLLTGRASTWDMQVIED